MLVKLFLVSLILGVTLAQDGHFDDPYANDKDFLKVEASGHDAANRTRVAILGGGMGGLSTAYYLSTGANAGKYNITIYQLGWRLGGKAATGRNPEFGNRLEEKGIHMLFGFYERVFGILSEVYNSLNRPPSHPLSSLNVGLRGQNGLCMNDPVIGKELNLWCTFLPVRGNDPWNRTKLGYDFYNINGNDDPYRALIFGLEKLEQYQTITFNNTRDVPTVLDISQVAQQCSQVYNNAEAFYYSDADDIVCKPQLKRLQAVIRENYHSGLIDELRRLLIEANLGLSIVFGLIEVRPSSFFDPVLDQYDFRAWLLMYGLLPEFKDSPPLNAIYMTSFCYVNGNRSDPNFAAGIAMLSMFNAFLDYEGHFGYYFIGGTGEVVFAPIYERLVQLGVKFEFFHKVESLNPSADNQSIESVDIAVQAQLKNPSAGYYPFITVDSELGKLEAWPNDPNWDQLVNGANLTNYDFESYYKTNYPTTPKKLKQGVDYDAVVLAISLGALPYITPKMMAVNPKWNAMVNGIKTTPTFGVQIWFNQSSSQLMVPAVAPPNEFSIASYVVPLDGVGDFSHVLPSEGWGNYSNPPQSVFYLCQAWEPLPGPHPLNETDYPDKENQHLIDVTIEWMNAGNFKLIPGAVNADNTLNYNLLVDPTGSSGVQRLKNQAFVTKVDPPTELYVLSGSQTLQYRIKPNESGFSNLYLAGDWTNNDLNYGCLEATVSSGQIAAGAIAFNYNKETL